MTLPQVDTLVPAQAPLIDSDVRAAPAAADVQQIK